MFYLEWFYVWIIKYTTEVVFEWAVFLFCISCGKICARDFRAYFQMEINTCRVLENLVLQSSWKCCIRVLDITVYWLVHSASTYLFTIRYIAHAKHKGFQIKYFTYSQQDQRKRWQASRSSWYAVINSVKGKCTGGQESGWRNIQMRWYAQDHLGSSGPGRRHRWKTFKSRSDSDLILLENNSDGNVKVDGDPCRLEIRTTECWETTVLFKFGKIRTWMKALAENIKKGCQRVLTGERFGVKGC